MLCDSFVGLKPVLHTANKDVHCPVGDELRGNFLDFIGPGGTEEQSLTLTGNGFDDALYLRLKTHVQHAVCFIKHQIGDLVQSDLS